MYFWNINALVQKLKTYSLSSYEQAQYYLALMFCISLGSLMQALPKPPTPTNATLIVVSWLAGLMVLIGGVMYCYNINKSGDNKDFLTRMICLLFTGAIRFLVLSLVAIIPLAMIVGYIIGLYATPTNIEETALIGGIMGGTATLLWAIGLYYYIGLQFKKIAQ